MKELIYIAGLSLALGNIIPVQAGACALDPAVGKDEVTEAQIVGQQFLSTASEMWFLLSGISNRDDADKSAGRFTALVQKTFELDNKLSNMPLVSPESECVGMMDGVQMRILETLDDLHVEFLSLCRANCYGSEALSKAFEHAVQLGMFAETDVEEMKQSVEPLTEDESQAELARIRDLLAPDREVLEVLAEVVDVESAADAVPKLARLTQLFEELIPPDFTGSRAFTPDTAMDAREAMAPIEPVLWGIRSEIVRIAALPGYEAETYDAFSAALDAVFECLGSTHCHLFESVFDASFRADLDNALRENKTISSQ